jgi:hypothetical protein
MMNNSLIQEVITINNCCIEDLHDGTIAHALSELQVAMHIFKQRAAVVVDPMCHEPHGTGFLHESSSTNMPVSLRPPPTFDPNCNHLPSSLHRHQQASSSSKSVVGIKFSPMAKPNPGGPCLLSQLSPKPISLCQHQLLLIAEDNIYASPSISANYAGNVSDAVSTEDVHLICATLLYNMGLFCHKYAYISNCSTHHTAPNLTNFIRASKIYELLIEFCDSRNMLMAGISHCPHQVNHLSTNVRMIQTIAYNNYAEICYELGNYTKYMHCMHEIQNHLSFLLLSRCYNNQSNDTVRSGTDIVYRDLQLNVLMYKMCPVPTLASAA